MTDILRVQIEHKLNDIPGNKPIRQKKEGGPKIEIKQ